MDGTLNLNQAECLRDVVQLGFTQVHNVCAGTITNVPWGMADWLGAIAIALMMTILVGLVAFLAVGLFVTIRR